MVLSISRLSSASWKPSAPWDFEEPANMGRWEALISAVVVLLAISLIAGDVDGAAVRIGRLVKRPGPQAEHENKTGGLLLPDNATLIRENIADTFSCKDRIYGYYADIENDCQIFHVCLPRANSVARWSFICPSETIFNQATFVCTREENAIPCQESDKFYELNEAIGKEVEEEEESDLDDEVKTKT